MPTTGDLRHFYHLCADLRWDAPAAEHAAALETAGLDCAMTIGIIGSPAARARARDWAETALAGRELAFTEASYGYEQLTLRAVRHWAQAHPAGKVAYAHTKGVLKPSFLADAWRHSMTRRVIGDWRRCTELLADHDAVGCHWMPPAPYPGSHEKAPFFGGNFWWANAAYLARLPEPATASRFDAERWIGVGGPTVFDLLPGPPSADAFGTLKVRMISEVSGGRPDGSLWPHSGAVLECTEPEAMELCWTGIATLEAQ